MSSEKQDRLTTLIKRLREEIVPVVERISSNDNLLFFNSHIVSCREALECKSADCAHYNNSGSARCWQLAAACCNGKPHDSVNQIHNACLNCKVFNGACPTIVEEIGEYLNSMSFLFNDQQKQRLDDKKHIANIQQELDSVLERLNKKKKEIQEIMITDNLTTLFNRQHLITVLEDEIARCQRYGRPLALIMIDIDGFRSFNDFYGHQAGDNMLLFIGTLIKGNTRKFDRAFRYGGEEFVIVLPESDITMAYIVAERIRKCFENNAFPVIEKESGRHVNKSRTVSIGVTATFAFRTHNVSIEELISQTEKALYQAKKQGGNVCVRYE